MKLRIVKKELVELDKVTMKEITGGKQVVILVAGRLIKIDI